MDVVYLAECFLEKARVGIIKHKPLLGLFLNGPEML